ncbi:hypothetical protein TELCIR_11929 [Teladorsagia circumcincta]|uniref:Uncharacterized protein n=1 Tax=Teladorsagia circumcincta TaxID=45464 RepID=A0A2G9U9G7_TELCI|nr:hypothetical protein TELCIR_11929 [Teladorsagia circumcincta]
MRVLSSAASIYTNSDPRQARIGAEDGQLGIDRLSAYVAKYLESKRIGSDRHRDIVKFRPTKPGVNTLDVYYGGDKVDEIMYEVSNAQLSRICCQVSAKICPHCIFHAIQSAAYQVKGLMRNDDAAWHAVE